MNEGLGLFFLYKIVGEDLGVLAFIDGVHEK